MERAPTGVVYEGAEGSEGADCAEVLMHRTFDTPTTFGTFDAGFELAD